MIRKIIKISLPLFAVVLTTSIALADWQESFLDDYSEKGLNTAVTNTLAAGISPGAIIETAMAIDGMNGEVLAAAVCDGGVPVQDLQDSLHVLEISQRTAITLCAAVQETFLPAGSFPGAGYSSVSRKTNYDGSNNTVQPASEHTFN